MTMILRSTSNRTILPTLNRINLNTNLVLASGSPRRKELLNLMGINNFEIIVSRFAEDLDKNIYSNPITYCSETARKKLEFTILDIKSSFTNLLDKPIIVIAADTIVVIDDTILEKPNSIEDSVKMLLMLNGYRSIFSVVTLPFSLGELILFILQFLSTLIKTQMFAT